MRLLALVLIFIAATLLIAPAGAQDKENLSPQEQSERAAKKIKELRQQRIVTLKEIVDRLSTLHKEGLASIEELYEARLSVLQAELDAAAPDADRVALYKNIVGVLTEYEQSADAMRKAVRSEGTAYLKIKARRLEAEIQWEEAKTKAVEARQ